MTISTYLILKKTILIFFIYNLFFLTARIANNTPKNNIPEFIQLFNEPIPKRKTLKKRVKKVDTIYRALNRRKPIIRSSKPARNTFTDNGINKKVSRFSNNDKVKNEEAYLCGPGISKNYINIIDTAIGCDLKMIIIFIKDML